MIYETTEERSPWKTAVRTVLIYLLLFSTVPLLFAQSNRIAEPPEALTLVSAETHNDTAAPHTVLGGNLSYLPIIIRPSLCDLNSEEAAVAQLAINDPGQQRPTMACHPILAQVARDKARDMAVRDYFDHTDPDGFGPNYLVRMAGYTLPNWYNNADDGNNIESIAAGYTSPEEVWAGWLSSGGHRAHVLAEASFWQEQTNHGIGYYYDASSTYQHYWVFISAPPE